MQNDKRRKVLPIEIVGSVENPEGISEQLEDELDNFPYKLIGELADFGVESQ